MKIMPDYASILIQNDYRIGNSENDMSYNSLKRTAKKLGVSEEVCDKIIRGYQMDELFDKILISAHTYERKGIEGLAEGATAFNKIYEMMQNTTSGGINDYFEFYYKKWICLVLETKDGQIYSYTKKDIVMAFRGLSVHGTTKKLKEEPKYLNGFLRGIENPDVLFFNAGNTAHCLPPHMRKEHSEKDYPLVIETKYHLDVKEIIILTILYELFNYTDETGPNLGSISLMPDTSYLEKKAPSIAKTISEQIDNMKNRNPQHPRSG